MLFMGLLFLNIIILMVMMFTGNNMNEGLMYALLAYIMISTPLYLFIQLNTLKKKLQKKDR
ncbi:MAG: hypothetical protein PUC68_04495 [Firmicutes bacterium]|nr:hypothetical protein [Bacillota bacterium]